MHRYPIWGPLQVGHVGRGEVGFLVTGLDFKIIIIIIICMPQVPNHKIIKITIFRRFKYETKW